MLKPKALARSGALLCVLAAACDRAPTGSAPAPAPSAPAVVGRLACTVTVSTGTVACTAPDPGTGAASGLVVGGVNGSYVFLTASGHTYTPADSVFSINVTLQNMLFQALGTTDGTTADGAGVRIFFLDEPAASVMTPPGTPLEPVELVNAQRGMITAANQAYFQYPGPLHPNATTEPVEWRFRLSPAVDRFTFSVAVSAAVQHPSGVVQVTPPADTLLASQTVTLRYRVVNAVGDSLPGQAVTWGTSDAAVATVSAGGVVTAVAPGTVTITATQGPRSGAATLAVCPDLAVGGVYVADMPAGARLCLGAGEYVVMPVNTGAVTSVSLALTGAGIVPVSGAPTPALLPGGGPALRAASPLARDDAWESRLRRMEGASLPRTTGGAPRGGTGGARMAITPGVPAVGALMSLNVETDDACSTNDLRTGRVVAVGTRIIILADTANPAGGLSQAQYEAVADSFDTVIWPTITGTFGAPGDIDGNGRVIAFYTRAVNELTPPGSSSYVGGFVFARDLYPAASCPTSNVGEMFYMLAADPAGEVNGNARPASFVVDKTLGTVAHEFQHLVNASRRMYVNTPWNGRFEEAWLNEGLSHVSEELVFYARTGTAPGGNLGLAQIADGGAVQTAFFRYAESNYARLRQWLLAPEADGAFQLDDDLATRGAAWAFLRYASDRHPSSDAAFFGALVNTGNRGLPNVQAVLGTDPLPWYRDFAAAMYGDDAGIGAAAPYTQPSWNFRGIFAALDYNGNGIGDGYPLAPRNPANGVADHITLEAGGAAAYARLGVPAGGFAGVTVLSGGNAPAATVRMSVIRRK